MEVAAEVLGHRIVARAEWLGPDLLVSVTGGCAPHIGASAIAWPAGPAGNAIAVQVNQRPHHREGVVAQRFARELSEHFKCCVNVASGIHYERPTPTDIDTILNTCWELLERIKTELKKRYPTSN
jgi:hypothetical protein